MTIDITPPFQTMNSIVGIKVVTNPLLVETVPYPRSLGRSKRRAKLGHKQHTITRPSRQAYKLPDGSMVMHPEMLKQLEAMIEAKKKAIEQATFFPTRQAEAHLDTFFNGT